MPVSRRTPPSDDIIRRPNPGTTTPVTPNMGRYGPEYGGNLPPSRGTVGGVKDSFVGGVNTAMGKLNRAAEPIWGLGTFMGATENAGQVIDRAVANPTQYARSAGWVKRQVQDNPAVVAEWGKDAAIALVKSQLTPQALAENAVFFGLGGAMGMGQRALVKEGAAAAEALDVASDVTRAGRSNAFTRGVGTVRETVEAAAKLPVRARKYVTGSESSLAQRYVRQPVANRLFSETPKSGFGMLAKEAVAGSPLPPSPGPWMKLRESRYRSSTLGSAAGAPAKAQTAQEALRIANDPTRILRDPDVQQAIAEKGAEAWASPTVQNKVDEVTPRLQDLEADLDAEKSSWWDKVKNRVTDKDEDKEEEKDKEPEPEYGSVPSQQYNFKEIKLPSQTTGPQANGPRTSYRAGRGYTSGTQRGDPRLPGGISQSSANELMRALGYGGGANRTFYQFHRGRPDLVGPGMDVGGINQTLAYDRPEVPLYGAKAPGAVGSYLGGKAAEGINTITGSGPVGGPVEEEPPQQQLATGTPLAPPTPNPSIPPPPPGSPIYKRP